MESGRMFLSAIILVCLSSCNDFRVAGNVNKTYTTEFNYPGTRVVPYNDPHYENKAQNKKINICEGTADKKGFKCKE